jgi:hypothetical protein
MERVDSVVLDAVFSGDGYYLGLRFSPEELTTIKGLITRQWLQRIDDKYPHLTSQFEAVGIENYHKLAHLVDHSALWPKKARMLNKEDARTVRGLPFFKSLERYLGAFDIADYEARGHEELTWRLVRPNEENDVGPLHQDTWFTEINPHFRLPEDKERTSFWTAIMTEPGLSGLKVVPGTQHEDFPHHYEDRDGMRKPVIDVAESTLDVRPCMMNPGDIILFNPRVLHGGMVSRGERCRISLECSLFFSKHLVA